MLDLLDTIIMEPLYFLTSAVLLGWHRLWGGLLGESSGWAWALSIVGLTIVIRAALIPLFVKQIKSSRNMQLIQPKVRELQKKYGHDRERLAQEQMKLFKETGTNPFSSCLPILVQMPIFFALFRLLNEAANLKPKGLLTQADAEHLSEAEIFGGTLSSTMTKSGGDLNVILLAATLVVLMTITTFITQRQLMSKNMPADALTGPYATQQKMLLYVLPLVFAVSGVAFPIGLIIYWTTSNIWTMGQQFYVIRNNPAPNTEAFRAKEQRDAAKARKKGLPAAETATPAPEEPVAVKPAPPRQQPQRKTRSQRNKKKK